MTSNIIIIWLVLLPRLLGSLIVKYASLRVESQAILTHPHKGNETPVSHRESKVYTTYNI